MSDSQNIPNLNDEDFDEIEKLLPDFGGSETKWNETRKLNLFKMLKFVISTVRESVKTVKNLQEEKTKLKKLIESNSAPESAATDFFWSNVFVGMKPNEQTQALYARVNKELNNNVKIGNWKGA